MTPCATSWAHWDNSWVFKSWGSSVPMSLLVTWSPHGYLYRLGLNTWSFLRQVFQAAGDSTVLESHWLSSCHGSTGIVLVGTLYNSLNSTFFFFFFLLSIALEGAIGGDSALGQWSLDFWWHLLKFGWRLSSLYSSCFLQTFRISTMWMFPVQFVPYGAAAKTTAGATWARAGVDMEWCTGVQ